MSAIRWVRLAPWCAAFVSNVPAYGQEYTVRVDVPLWGDEVRTLAGDAEPLSHPLMAVRPQLIEAWDREADLTEEEFLDRLEIFWRGAENEDGSTVQEMGVVLHPAVKPAPAATEEVAFEPYVAPDIDELLTAQADGKLERDVWIDVRIGLRRDQWDITEPWDRTLSLAILRGDVETWGDARRLRLELAEEKAWLGEMAMAPIIVTLEQLGAEVLEVEPTAGTLRAKVLADRLSKVLDIEALNTIELTSGVEPDSGLWTTTGGLMDGVEIEDELQSIQFYYRGWSGQHQLAMIEAGADSVWQDHPGFEKGSGVQRYTNCPFGGPLCNGDEEDPGAVHATAGASILLGDVTDGQDPDLDNDGDNDCLFNVNPELTLLECRRRSGVARTATALGTEVTYQSPLAHSAAYDIHLLTRSESHDLNPDPNCLGRTTGAQNVNTLYEGGYAYFKSAGNLGYDPAAIPAGVVCGDDQVTSTSDCTLGDPAAAIGAFVVGASNYNPPDPRTYHCQSRGGTASEGVRTIMSVQGIGPQEWPYPNSSALFSVSPYGTDWDGEGGDPPPQYHGATSGSTSLVAGAAELVADWSHSTGGIAWNSPGTLYSLLLLMGDRGNGLGSYQTTGFNNLSGAGELRLRHLDADGVDNPAGWAWGSVCVLNGAATFIDLNPPTLPIPGGADRIKAVIWWYDHLHETGAGMDQVDLALQKRVGFTWSNVVTSTGPDNKQMVYRNLTSTEYVPMRLRIYGDSITHKTGCFVGTTVYYAYLWEDDSRDDPELEMDWVRGL